MYKNGAYGLNRMVEDDAFEFQVGQQSIYVSAKDRAFVEASKWRICGGYVRRDGDNKRLSHLITGFVYDGKLVVDHMDRNVNNYCRSNLRIASCRQNTQNRSKPTGASSSFLGVTWCKATKKWAARTRYTPDGKRLNLGYFENERMAAYAYNVAVLGFDTNARINDLKPGEVYDLPQKRKPVKVTCITYKDGRYRATGQIERRRLSKTFDTEQEAQAQVNAWKVEAKQAKRKRFLDKVTVEGNVATIQVNKRFVKVDATFIEFATNHVTDWQIEASGYCQVRIDRGTLVRLAEVVFGKAADFGNHVDHINRDRLDNRVQNLREVSWGVNMHNSDRRSQRSQYHGIHQSGKRWTANLTNNGKRYRQTFDTELQAAEHYNKLAHQFYGENAKLNVI